VGPGTVLSLAGQPDSLHVFAESGSRLN
jgi:hypothetical protein